MSVPIVAELQHCAALEALPAGVIITDATGRVITVNDLAASQLGRRREECVGQALEQIVTLPRSLRELAGNSLCPGRYVDVSIVRPPVGAVPTAMCVGGLGARNGEPSGYLCLIQPSNGVAVTSVDGLQHVERLIAMGQMVAGFAHEVRNPLAALKSLVENLVAESAENDPRGEDLVRIERLVRRIENLVRSSLQFSKPNTPLREAHDVATLTQAAIDMLAPRIRATRADRLVATIEPGIPRVFVDDNQLVQVLIILLNNALDATQDAGRISVRARQAEPSGSSLDGSASVLIEVEDEGPGIPAETVDRIFDPFFTTKARGTGLGLSIALRLVLENRGQIHVRSRVGAGSVFTVELPVQTTP